MATQNLLGGYEVRGYRGLSNGAFEASVYRNGKRILTASNRGDGGSNYYHSTKQTVETWQQLLAELLEHTTSVLDLPEATDTFVETLINISAIKRHATRLDMPLDKVMEANIEHMRKSTFPPTEQEVALYRAAVDTV